ncbi:hypothetical protein [Pseudomonas sp. Ps21-P2]|uniref:hypothetical protein n=1 Tax=Pseudomonas sp. Ps21-P2 TaxID=3080331 RepID=UPI0032097F91
MSIKIKEAVQIALDNVVELFGNQQISGVLLEEVARDERGNFLITVGFERPSTSRATRALGGTLAAIMATDRAYKVVSVAQDDGDIISVKDRFLDKR